MSILQNPSQVIATRKVLAINSWTEAQQRVEELNLGSWDSIKTAWDNDPLYANTELRTPVLLIGEDWVFFINGLYDNQPASPYASWIWNTFTRNWEAPVPRPANPKHFYDLLWNEDTQKWGLSGININKIGEDGERYAVKRKYFDDWEKLIEYLYKINTVKYVHDQIAQQELQPLKDRKIISPASDAAPGKTDYICLEMIE